MSPPLSTSPSSASRNTRTIAAKPGMSSGAGTDLSSLPAGATITVATAGATAFSNGNGGPLTASPEASATRSFVPQFSAATQMILKRLRGEGGLLNPNSPPIPPYQVGNVQPPGYENVRRSVLEGMRTTLNMDMATTTPPPAKKPKARGEKGVGSGTNTPTSSDPTTGAVAMPNIKPAVKAVKIKAGTKRKRVRDESDSAEESGAMSGLGGDSDSDGSGSVTNLPTKTLSGRNVIKPAHFDPAAQEGPVRKRSSSHFKRTGRNVESALCKRCGRGHSPASNMIVFCDGCNNGWHQMCHDPIISDEVIKDELAQWFCKDCSAKRGRASKSKTPPEAVPNAGWAAKTAEEKRAYLTSMPHSHLVNLLLQAATLHPDIALPLPPPGSAQKHGFQLSTEPQSHPNSARRYTVYPQQPFPPSAATQSGLFKRAEANPSAPINFIRKLQLDGSGNLPPPYKSPFGNPTSQLQQSSYTPQMAPQSQAIVDDYESRESTPASPPYPKPGSGLMAKLPPDDQDLEWLVGEGEDEAAFSHMVFDDQGRLETIPEFGVTAAGKL